MISRNREFLLTCITKFSCVSIWTNTGEAIYSIFTSTAVVASNPDTIIDVWKQTTHKTLAQLKKLLWVRVTLVTDVKARYHLDAKTILKIYYCSDWLFRISIIQAIYRPLFLTKEYLKTTISNVVSVTDSYKISLNSRSNQLEFWGTLLLTLPLFDWPDDRLINIPEMKISLTNYCYCYCCYYCYCYRYRFYCRCRRRHRSC